MSTVKSVLITGANGGLGLATTRLLLSQGIDVVATSRRPEGLAKIKEAVVGKPEFTGNLSLMLCDIERGMFSEDINRALQRVDGVINNAGSAADLPKTRNGEKSDSILALDWTEFQKAVWVNAEGPRRIMRLCVPAMLKRKFGRIVNVSSARASLGTIVGEIGAPSYDLSKLVLNGFTAHMGHELEGSNVLVNALCPGWCQTPMGGSDAPETAEMGAERIVALLNLPEGSPNGRFYMNNEIAPF
jgi:NAD(P)-dependent dehydrogenase (short-subunit alcohol dehydrogenase family)